MFKRIGTAVALLALIALALGHRAAPAGAAESKEKIRVLVATGGHDFDRKGFEALWNGFPSIQWQEVQQKDSSEALDAKKLAGVDVLATYDMVGKTTDEQRRALESFLKRGGGLLVMHHSIAARPDWPEWERIMGGKFFLKPEERDGKKIPISGYQHDVDLRVHVADPKHPVTRGVSDFDIHDEIYWGYAVDPKDHILLTTDHPKSAKELGWAREEGPARIVFVQLGHDAKAYENPAYRKIIEQAVIWTAKK
jgi:hypothetical protein